MMQEVIEKTNTPRSLVDLWKDMQEALQTQRTSQLITPSDQLLLTNNKKNQLTKKGSQELENLTQNPMQSDEYKKKKEKDSSNNKKQSILSGSKKRDGKEEDYDHDDESGLLPTHDLSDAQISKPASIEMVDRALKQTQGVNM
jgi:CHASE3 domain sensor protein